MGRSSIFRRLLAASIVYTASLAPAQEQLFPSLPPRAPDAPTGTEFYQAVGALSATDREIMVWQQVALGNVPDFLRTLKPITVTRTISGTPRTAVYYVAPDYVAVGSDEDFFRQPLSADMAQWIADLAGCSLPTRRMVDAIHANAPVKLAPFPFSPATYNILSVDVFRASNTKIEEQRAGHALGLLVSGIKKDVVVTPELLNRPAPLRVAIYGWHQLNGTPIQPLSLVHEFSYADYSHGARLVHQRMWIDGVETTVSGTLSNAAVAELLSDEGAFANTRYVVGAPPALPPAFPLTDDFPSDGRDLAFWSDRYKTHTVVAFSPPAPGGDGNVLLVRDTSGGIDTARIGTGFEKDYFVEAYIYCDYRPQLASDGYDRTGIFLRDNGNGLFTGQSGAGVQGNCYAMVWESNTGRLQCVRTLAGVPVDLNPAPVLRPTPGWRLMRIEAEGTELHFILDGETILTTTDGTHTQGQFGIGYQELFTTNTNIVGTRAEGFRAGRLEPSTWIVR